MKRRTESTKVLERGLMALEHVVKTSICSTREISEKTGMSRTATYRILESLTQCGYLHRNSYREAYRLTPKVLELSSSISPSVIVSTVARQIMADVTKRTGWPLLLGYIDDIDLVVLETSDHLSRHDLKQISCGERIPQYLRSSGAVCKALLDPVEARRINRKTAALYGDKLLSKSENYREHLLDRVRKRGFVIFEPLRSKESSIAVPIKIGPSSNYGLEIRFNGTVVKSDTVKTEFLPAMQKAAAAIVEKSRAEIEAHGLTRRKMS